MSHNQSQQGGGSGRGRGQHSLPIHPRHEGPSGSSGSRGGSSIRAEGESRARDPEIFSQGEAAIVPIDLRVKKIEEETATRIKEAGGKLLRLEMPLRPGYGTLGKNLLLLANYFQILTKDQELILYRYTIEMKADGGGKAPVGKKAKRIIQILLEEHLQLYKASIATDFRKFLISGNPIETWQSGYVITYRAEDEDDPAANAKQYRLFLQEDSSCSIAELKRYLGSSQPDLTLDSKGEIVQALNIILGYYSKNSLATINVGANKHFDRNPAVADTMPLGAGLKAIRGIFTSAQPATARLLLNVQVKNMAFYNDDSLVNLMKAFIKETKGYSTRALDRFVKGLSVDATHISQTNRFGGRIRKIKTIQGLATEHDGRTLPYPPKVPNFGASSKDVQFFLNEAGGSNSKSSKASEMVKKGAKAPVTGSGSSATGDYISVLEFFRQKYSILINPAFPVLNVGNRQNPTYLPAEVCQVLAGQPALADLSPEQTAEMIKFAVRKPAQNARTIVEQGARLLSLDPPNPVLQAFAMRVVPKLLTVSGRVLNSPTVNYADKKTVTPRSGSWNAVGARLVTRADLPKWVYLRIQYPDHQSSRKEPEKQDQDFEKKVTGLLYTTMRKLGIAAAPCSGGFTIKTATENLEPEIHKAVKSLVSTTQRPTLLLVILPEKQTTVAYNLVKYICDVKVGILDLCILENKVAKAISKKDDQYFMNVCLKVNLKLGGRNHSLDPTKLGFIRERKTMVIGIDVTHPSPGSSSHAPSVVGVVASIDEWLGQWPGELRIQTARQEMVNDLAYLTDSRLQVWLIYNQILPERFLIYRDGVSTGQYSDVLSKELPAIRQGCERLYKKFGLPSPRITIIIVTKRHHTRFYPTLKSEADQKSWNTASGTVVDRGVTEARNWDFFLQAHAAIQGTAKPAHYYIIYDEIFRNMKLPAPFKNPADVIEDLTHNMCYLFGRATKAVSVCPPAYYADLLCYRARCYLSSVFDPDGGSSHGGSVVSGAGGVSYDNAIVTPRQNVRHSMFYA